MMKDGFKNFSRRIGKKKEEKDGPKVFGVPFDRTSNKIPLVIKRIVEYFDVKGSIFL
jgi:hypothetical protein